MLHIISIVTFWAGVTFSAGHYVYNYVERHPVRRRIRNPREATPGEIQEIGKVIDKGYSSGYRDSDSYIEESYRYEQE